MKMYVYDLETMKALYEVDGADNAECEKKAEEVTDGETMGWTYSPAWGFNGGLIENPEMEII